MENMVEIKGRSSDLIQDLFGDTRQYSKAVASFGRSLRRKYPDEQLASIFAKLESRTVTILPMAFCDALSSDLKNPVSKQTLAAVGLACVVVATHDDVVDEMPSDQKILAGLVYGGDITNLHAIRTLMGSGDHRVVPTLIDTLTQNHYLQTKVVDKLWNTGPVSNEQYFDAVKHWCAFCSIGPMCALALSDRMDLKNRVQKFSTAYGTAFQLLDDVREIDEDKAGGYQSIPVQEGYPYTETFRLMHSRVNQAKELLSPRWLRMNQLVDSMQRVVSDLENGIHKTQT